MYNKTPFAMYFKILDEYAQRVMGMLHLQESWYLVEKIYIVLNLLFIPHFYLCFGIFV